MQVQHAANLTRHVATELLLLLLPTLVVCAGLWALYVVVTLKIKCYEERVDIF
jgi:hypothetical protein